MQNVGGQNKREKGEREGRGKNVSFGFLNFIWLEFDCKIIGNKKVKNTPTEINL